uniref:Uncharacterized protein n=1 Tax=viral metagenome TaxID=1070528 RepID=A0A6M3KYK6_9ZZZZ
MRKTFLTGALSVLVVLALAFGVTAADRENFTVGNLTVERSLNVQGLMQGAVNTTGNVFYVDSGSGINAIGRGKTAKKPLASLAYAFSSDQLTASNSDVVVAMPGHTETISSSGGIAMDIAGVMVIGLGTGTSMPTFTYTTTQYASITITADDVTVKGCRFKIGASSSADGLVAAFDISAANADVSGNEFILTATSAQMAAAIVLDASADDSKIFSNTFIGSTDTGAVAAIQYTTTTGTGSTDRVEIAHNTIYGDFSTAPVTGAYTGTLNRIHNNAITNFNSGDFAIEFTGAAFTRASIYDNIISTDSPVTAIDPGITVAKLTGNRWDRYGGIDGGRNSFELFSGAERTWTVTEAALPATDYTLSLFSVTGPIEIMSLCGVVTTVIQAQANATIIGYSPNSLEQKTIIGGSLDINGHKLGSVYTIPGTVGGTLTNSVDNGALIGQEDGQTLVVPAGWLGIHCAATNTGNITWTLRYRPVTAEAAAYTTAP